MIMIVHSSLIQYLSKGLEQHEAMSLQLPYSTQLTHLLINNYMPQVVDCLDSNNYEMLQEVLVYRGA